MKTLAAIAMVAALAGCATPATYTTAPMTEVDSHTAVAVTPRPNGFEMVVRYARFQFFPESSAVAVACRSALTSLAHRHAEKAGRAILPINDERIQLSMGRNGMTGITSCSALAVVEWRA